MRGVIRSILRTMFRIPPGVSFSFWWMNVYAKRILRINADCPWPVHITSTIIHPGRVKFGRGHYPGDSPGNYIQAYNGIEIGDDVNLAPNVGLISANHDPLDNSRHLKAPPIKIGDHSWIGISAVVLPGVELGPYTIVGAGSVVTKSFPEGRCVLAGSPARIVRKIDTASERDAAI